MIFASLTLPELTPIFGLFAGMLVAFYGFMKNQNSQHTAMMDALTKERELAAQQASLERRALITSATADRESERDERRLMRETLDRVAKASERGADEAKERNGHLAELQLQSQEIFKNLADRNYKAITNIKEQHVAKQIVDNETVNHKSSDK